MIQPEMFYFPEKPNHALCKQKLQSAWIGFLGNKTIFLGGSYARGFFVCLFVLVLFGFFLNEVNQKSGFLVFFF
jgi:hypothetical protein